MAAPRAVDGSVRISPIADTRFIVIADTVSRWCRTVTTHASACIHR